MASVEHGPKPSIVDCRAGGARPAVRPRTEEDLPDATLRTSAHSIPEPRGVRLQPVNCVQNDWHWDAERLVAALAPSFKTLSGSALGVTVTLDSLKTALQQEPTPLQSILDAYSKLVKDAKQKRKSKDDTWPVIIIDEANRLEAWEDKASLEQLLAFFVYLSKQ